MSKLDLEKISKAADKELSALALPRDLEGVQNAVSENPQKYARWSFLEARLRYEVEAANIETSRLESELAIEYNDEAAKSRKHLTDTKLKISVKADNRFCEAKLRVAKLTELLFKLSSIVQAYSQRGFASQALLRSIVEEAALNIK